MMWAALYQQRPAPEEGDYFKAAWLKPYEALPPRETLRVYGGSDYAVTADGGDYTAGDPAFIERPTARQNMMSKIATSIPVGRNTAWNLV